MGALLPFRPRLLRQPSGLVRLNEKHWLAGDVVFAHSGHQAFAFGAPLPAVSDLLSAALAGGTSGAAFEHAQGWAPDSTNYSRFDLGAPVPQPVTLSCWWFGMSTPGTNPVLWLMRPSGDGGVGLTRQSDERASAVWRNTSGTTGYAASTGTYSSSRWQHGVGVFTGESKRAIYADGVLGQSQTNTGAYPTDCSVVQIARDPTGLTAVLNRVRFISAPLILGRTLDPDEVARLHDEQRSNPWVLFAERRIWVPVSTAGGGTAYNESVSETASAADSASSAFSASGAVAEAASAAESMSGLLVTSDSVTESLSASDTVSAIMVAVAAISEPLSATDLFTTTVVYPSSVSEATSATDTANWSGSSYSVDLAESVSAIEAISAAVDFLCSLAESGSTADVVVAVMIANPSVSESSSASEILTAVGVFSMSVSESASADDIVVAASGSTLYFWLRTA